MNDFKIDIVGVSQCLLCEHFTGRGTCRAYTGNPFAIPTIILCNEHDHAKPYPGDSGILFSATKPEYTATHKQQIEAAARSKYHRERANNDL